MMDYSFDRTNQHLASCVHCMLENALLNTKEPATAMLLQAAIGAFNRMGENVEEQRKGAFASWCTRRAGNGGHPCRIVKVHLREIARNHPESYLGDGACFSRCLDSGAYAQHCEQVKARLTMTRHQLERALEGKAIEVCE